MSTPQGPHGTPRRGDDADSPQAPDEPDWGTPPAGGWGGGWSAEPQAGQGWGSAGRDQGEQAGYGSPQHGAQYGGAQSGPGQYGQARYDQAGYDHPQQPGYGSHLGEQQYPGEQQYGGQQYGDRRQGEPDQGWSGHRPGAEQNWSGTDQGWDPTGTDQGGIASSTGGWHEDQVQGADRGRYTDRAPEGGGDPAREQQWAPEQEWDGAGSREKTEQGRGGDRQGWPDGPVDQGRQPAWSGEQGWSPEHGTQGPPDEQVWAGHQGRSGQQGREAPMPPARDPREAQPGSRRSPGRPGRSPVPFVIGGLVLVLLVAAAVVLFVTPGYLTTRTLDQGALNQGVARILQQDYKLGATDVSCPSGVEVAPGGAFTCDAKVDGEAVKVPVTILDEDGTYQVRRV